jgi:hypothetical protein
MNTSIDQNTIFPKGEKAAADYFTGTGMGAHVGSE